MAPDVLGINYLHMDEEMAAMERIRWIKDVSGQFEQKQAIGVVRAEDILFLLKAIKVWRKIAIEYADQSWHRGDPKEMNKEFEKGMAGDKEK